MRGAQTSAALRGNLPLRGLSGGLSEGSAGSLRGFCGVSAGFCGGPRDFPRFLGGSDPMLVTLRNCWTHKFFDEIEMRASFHRLFWCRYYSSISAKNEETMQYHPQGFWLNQPRCCDYKHVLDFRNLKSYRGKEDISHEFRMKMICMLTISSQGCCL